MARATSQSAVQPLEFVGPPRRLVAVGTIPQLDDPPTISGALAKFLPSDRQALRQRGGIRRASQLSLRLAPETPEGTYKGKLISGKSELPVTARVLGETRVSILAGDLNFSGPLESKATATLAIANNGNTEIHLPRAMPIGLFDDDGLETAFAASYAEPKTGIDDFFSTFHGKLREAHSGILKLAVTRGYGAHAPGTSFSADFSLSITKPLRAGHRYHGVASTGFADFSIALSVINGAAS